MAAPSWSLSSRFFFLPFQLSDRPVLCDPNVFSILIGLEIDDPLVTLVAPGLRLAIPRGSGSLLFSGGIYSHAEV